MFIKRMSNLIALMLVLLSGMPAQASALLQKNTPVFNQPCPKLSLAQLQEDTFIKNLPAGCLDDIQSLIVNQESSSQLPQPKASGGPDNFGYTWNDSEPVNWIDVSTGTDTNFTNSYPNAAALSVDIPFAFKYFEYVYDKLYIVSAGYLSFTEHTTWPSWLVIPDPSEINNVIAPYVSSMQMVNTSWVRYMSAGIAPNRYFVTEWHDLRQGSSAFNFEVILYENGDIVFQYAAMTYASSGASCAGTALYTPRTFCAHGGCIIL